MGLTMRVSDERIAALLGRSWKIQDTAGKYLYTFETNLGVELMLDLQDTRAALAEAERERDEAVRRMNVSDDLGAKAGDAVERWVRSCAAREADVKRLRDAASMALADLDIVRDSSATARLKAALAQQPEQEALRAMLERVAAFAWDRGWDAARDGDDATIVKRDVSDAVDSILRDGGAK